MCHVGVRTNHDRPPTHGRRKMSGDAETPELDLLGIWNADKRVTTEDDESSLFNPRQSGGRESPVATLDSDDDGKLAKR